VRIAVAARCHSWSQRARSAITGALSGVHRPGDLPYPRQGASDGALLWAVRQRPSGEGQEALSLDASGGQE